MRAKAAPAIKAINKAQAVIELELDGTLITANETLLRISGYGLAEIVGKHHRIFCDPGYAKSAQYVEFWQKLGRGEYHTAEFKRLAKKGEEIWLRASYNPVFDKDGKPVKIVFQRADAEDVMQETASVLWKKFDEFERGSHFDRWAFRVWCQPGQYHHFCFLIDFDIVFQECCDGLWILLLNYN